MVSSWGLYLILLLLKCYISITSSFLTFPARASNSNTLSVITTARLNVRPWPTVSTTSTIDDFQIKKLGELSTNFDVLKALQETRQFAPYIGSYGLAVITGGTGGIGLPVSIQLHLLSLPLCCCPELLLLRSV
jgi:hypothetical protein